MANILISPINVDAKNVLTTSDSNNLSLSAVLTQRDSNNVSIAFGGSTAGAGSGAAALPPGSSDVAQRQKTTRSVLLAALGLFALIFLMKGKK